MNTVKRFQRKIEDFTCMNCSSEVIGDGYTNHCPACLCSRHVDIFPGDRLEECGGLMPVTSYNQGKKKIILTHTCKTCAEKSNDHFREGVDNFDALLKIITIINNKNS